MYQDTNFLFVDIPGTYSIMSNSVDATCLERNLNLVFQTMEITNNIVVCVNLLDEAKKKKIHIDLEKLSDELGVPVVGTTARKKKTLTSLMNTIKQVCTR